MDLFRRLDFNAKGAETVQVRTAVGGIGACVGSLTLLLSPLACPLPAATDPAAPPQLQLQ